MRLLSRSALCSVAGALALGLLGGCAAPDAPGPRQGPASVVPERLEAWRFPGSYLSRKLVTPHYTLYTTIESEEVVRKLGQLMEGALGQYQTVAPGLAPIDRPLDCYLFQSRSQWARFTETRAGSDAPIYLRINRGGYTIGDWYVAYFIGDMGTYSVAAHEGFHQFVARCFASRPPPFLEEGLACLFEDVKWEQDLPRWNLSENLTRLNGLRAASAADKLIPLDELVAMHAGQVVDTAPIRIRAFYAQSWAFARFCREAEGGRYRTGLEKLLLDCARGRAYPPNGAVGSASASWQWDPESAKPLLERYLQLKFSDLNGRYQDWVRQLVSDPHVGVPESGF